MEAGKNILVFMLIVVGTISNSFAANKVQIFYPFENIDDYTSLANAVSSIRETKTTLIVGTDQTISDDLTIPSTLGLYLINGAIITIAAGKTLTIMSPFSVGQYQVFAGTGSVKGLKSIDPTWWGASPSASASVNTVAIQTSINALTPQGSWILPAGTFTTNAPLLFKDLLDCTIMFKGNIINNTTGGLVFDNMDRCSITGINVGRSMADPSTWADNGVIFLNALNRTTIQISRIFAFQKGLNIYMTGDNPLATGGAWNIFNLGELRDNQYGIWVENTGSASTGGYFNQNTFNHGIIRTSAFMSISYPTEFLTTWGVWFVKPTGFVYSNNVFNEVDMEMLGNGMRIVAAYNFFLNGVRWETVANNYLLAESGSSLTIRPATDFDSTKFSFTSQMRGINILGSAQYKSSRYKSLLMDDRFGGLSFGGALNTNSTLTHLSTNYAMYPATLQITNYLSSEQLMDKQYTDSAAPTTGTYNKNAIVWNTNVIAGQVMGWVASRAGTMGKLSGVTGDININTSALRVNKATALSIGQKINVAGAVAEQTIINIVGNEITLSGNATATVKGAAVSYFAAQWLPMALYP